MSKEISPHIDQKELRMIVNLQFGDVVTGTQDESEQFLILGAMTSDNIHGSLLHFTDDEKPYILAGGGGTMSDFEFGKLVVHLSVDETIEIANRGWKIQFGVDLPSELDVYLRSEADLPAVLYRRERS